MARIDPNPTVKVRLPEEDAIAVAMAPDTLEAVTDVLNHQLERLDQELNRLTGKLTSVLREGHTGLDSEAEAETRIPDACARVRSAAYRVEEMVDLVNGLSYRLAL